MTSNSHSSLRISKDRKKRLQNLAFVRKQSDEKIIEELMDFYEQNTEIHTKWKKKSEK